MEKFRIFLAELFELEKEALFYWSAVLYGTGVGIYFSLSFEPPLAPVILGLAVLFLVQYFVRARAALLLGLRALLILLTGFGAGALRTSLVDTTTLSRETWAIALEGVVSVAEQRIEDGLRLTLKGVSYPDNPGQTLPDKIRIVVRTQAPELGPGDVIRTRAVLMPLPGPVLPGGYDFGRQLWFRGLGAVGFAVAPVEAVSRPERILEEKIGAFRQKMWLRITTAVPGEDGAVAAALITGIRDGIPERVSNNMRIAGLAHLLAISGLHMALITGVLFFALRAGMAFFPKLALKHPIRKYAAIGAFIGASGYLVLSGASISTQRAFIMVSIVLLAVLTDRKAISMRSVTLAAVAILTFTPEAVLHPSFQMSFAAVTGLVAGYSWAQPRLSRLFHANPGFLARVRLYMLGVLISTLIAAISIGPVAFYHFGRFSAFGLLANMAAVPVMAFWVMPMGLVGMVLTPLGLDLWAWKGMAAGTGLILDVAEQIAALPGADFWAPEFPFSSFLLLVLAGLWLCLWQGKRLRLLFVAPLGLALVIYFSHDLPEVVINTEGDLVALKGPDGRFYFNTLSRSRFDRGIWQRHFAEKEALSFRDFPEGGGLACDPLGCLYQTRSGKTVAISTQPEAFAADCSRADVILTAHYAPFPCKDSKIVIDKTRLRRGGAHTLSFDREGVIIRSVTGERGMRPWSEVSE